MEISRAADCGNALICGQFVGFLAPNHFIIKKNEVVLWRGTMHNAQLGVVARCDTTLEMHDAHVLNAHVFCSVKPAQFTTPCRHIVAVKTAAT
jgi:hypothetical protein